MTVRVSSKLPLGKKSFFALSAMCVAALFLFVHPDAMETAAHGHLFLDSLFRGEPRSFYGLVAQHQNDFYYMNNAHYNIVVYMLYAAAQLPVYLVCAATGAVPAQMLLTFWGKGMCAVFYVGCLIVTRRVAAAAGLGEKAVAAPLLVGLWPPLFFSVFVMGQYDIICLFFMLLGLLFYFRRKMLPFALWFGVAIAVKNFPAFLFFPLLLLREKRPLKILLYGACALWLLAPSTLVYRGVAFSKPVFDALMMERLFTARLPFARELPVFPLLFALLCVAAYFWRPGKERFAAASLYVGLCSFAVVFLLVEWHPQWVVLLCVFVVLTGLWEPRSPYWLPELLLYMGFFLVCAAAFPGQLEANLLDNGLLGLLGAAGSAPRPTSLADWYIFAPFLGASPTALFSAGLLSHLALKLPLGESTVAERLWKGTLRPPVRPLSHEAIAWGLFAAGFGGFFLLPVLVHWAGNL